MSVVKREKNATWVEWIKRGCEACNTLVVAATSNCELDSARSTLRSKKEDGKDARRSRHPVEAFWKIHLFIIPQ